MHLRPSKQTVAWCLTRGSSRCRAGGASEFRIPLPELQRAATVRRPLHVQGARPGAWPTGKLTAPIPSRFARAGELGSTLAAWTGRDCPNRQRAELAVGSTTDRAAESPKSTAQALARALAGPQLGFWPGTVLGPASQASSYPTYRGWTALELELAGGEQTTLVVYRPVIATAWSLCLALISAGQLPCRSNLKLAGSVRWRCCWWRPR